MSLLVPYYADYRKFLLFLFCSFLLLTGCRDRKNPHKTVVFQAPRVQPEDTIHYPNALITTLNRRNAWVDSVFSR